MYSARRAREVKDNYSRWCREEAKKTNEPCISCKGSGLTAEGERIRDKYPEMEHISGSLVCFRCDGTGKELHGGDPHPFV